MTDLALIYDDNSYKIVRLLSQDKKSVSIELLDANKLQKKIKFDNLVDNFSSSDPEKLITSVSTLSQEIDQELLWELSSDNQLWNYESLAELYFSDSSLAHKIALFITLTSPEIYFVYNQKEKKLKRCNQEEINQHKLQIAKQKEYQEKFDRIYNKLINKEQPEWQIDPLSLLNKPDKNSIEFKASSKAAKELKLTLAELLFELGYIKSIEELMTTNFIRHYFPQGTELANITINDHSEDIPFNNTIKVFSIDDSNTTEIDDAFSVEKINDGWKIGIHISAPSLNKELLSIASSRISTVYYPGHKITMLPEQIISHYSLDQGKELPVVSIYFTIDNQMAVVSHESKLELVKVSDNLRTETLEQYFNSENLSIDHGYPYESELKLLHKFALALEEKRGRPSVNQLMVDYNFSFGDDGQVIIKPRLRGNPIDKLVSELMILANCTWGRMLTNAFIPAIYRVKQPREPVVMTLTPNSHTGLNVDYYTWATSPLRRAADIVNQSQIISLLTKTKPLAATDYAVANIVENFDDVYSAYLKFQDSMEHYWSLRYFLQENITQVNAIFTFKCNVQLDGVPIQLDISHLTAMQAAGTVIKLAISDINLINQTFNYRIIT
jgi:exoribonuclease-2